VLTNEVNGKVYVGATINWTYRLSASSAFIAGRSSAPPWDSLRQA